MKQKDLNIVYICDESYAFATLVSIRSLKAHRNKELKYHVHIIAKNLSEQSVNALKAESEKETFHIVIRTSQMEFSEILSEHLYVSKAALIKFALPSILDNFDKILYVDGDILFRDGFEEIFTTNIENVYAAVVKDMSTSYESKHLQELGLNDYFNSGVMYLNLEKMRCDGIEQKLLEYKMQEKIRPVFVDQDAFNVIFHGNVLFIHPRFNFIYDNCRHYAAEQIASFYHISVSETSRLNQEASLLHMAGGKKPWNNLESEQLEEWLDYIQDAKEVLKWGQKSYGKNVLELRRELNNVWAEVKNMQSELQRIHEETKSCFSSLDVLREQVCSIESSYGSSINILKEHVSSMETDYNKGFSTLKEQITNTENSLDEKERDDKNRQALYEDMANRLAALENMILLRMYRRIKKCLRGT